MHSEKSSRVKELDAVRGAAMLAVCISHSSEFIDDAVHPHMHWWLVSAGMVATPTFLLLSGVVCGYLATISREPVAYFRRRLIDRGLFLLVVAHLALGFTHAMWKPWSAAVLGSFYITDAVGVGLIVAAWVAPFVGIRRLLFGGAGLFIGAWLIASLLAPAGSAQHAWLRLLVGMSERGEQDEGYLVPILPYMGIFLLGLAGGRFYGSPRGRAMSLLQISNFCLCLAGVCVASAVSMRLLCLASRPHLAAQWLPSLMSFTDLFRKIPPSPAYILMFGGAGAFTAALAFRLSHMARATTALSMLSTVGRASLLTYVLQYWCFQFPAEVLRVNTLYLSWFVVFPLAVAMLWFAAAAWDRAGYNRYLTLGIRMPKTATLPQESLKPRLLAPAFGKEAVSEKLPPHRRDIVRAAAR